MLYKQKQQLLCRQHRFLEETGRLTYSLTEDTLPDGGSYYSITIDCAGDALLDHRTVRNFTTDRQEALRIFWQLCRGTVTPYGLLEILPELLP